MLLLECICEGCHAPIRPDELVVEKYDIWALLGSDLADQLDDLDAPPIGQASITMHRWCKEQFDYEFQQGWDAHKIAAEEAMAW